eukprot:XP_001612102.1 hypothetical protein [Babesia bovis T2Bo]
MTIDVSPSALQTLFKSYSGFAPSISELDAFKQKSGPTCTPEQIKELVDTLEHPEDTRENFLKFFKFYDTNNTGTVSRDILEKLLTNVGEPLTQEEISAFFKKTCPTGDQIPYEQLINKYVHSSSCLISYSLLLK